MKTSIFILEDNMTQVKTLTRYIHNYAPDIELCIASSKEEAFILLKNHPDFNAYLLDVSLGSADLDTDGLAVANYIIDSRTTTAAGNRNIIFITAFPEHIYTAVNDIHCTAYLLKPYTQKDLSYRICLAIKNIGRHLCQTEFCRDLLYRIACTIYVFSYYTGHY